MNIDARRYWINQPSTLQPLHKMHGRRVIAFPRKGDNDVTVYFVDGTKVSSLIPILALSEGWPDKEDNKTPERKYYVRMPKKSNHHGLVVCDLNAEGAEFSSSEDNRMTFDLPSATQIAAFYGGEVVADMSTPWEVELISGIADSEGKGEINVRVKGPFSTCDKGVEAIKNALNR